MDSKCTIINKYIGFKYETSGLTVAVKQIIKSSLIVFIKLITSSFLKSSCTNK